MRTPYKFGWTSLERPNRKVAELAWLPKIQSITAQYNGLFLAKILIGFYWYELITALFPRALCQCKLFASSLRQLCVTSILILNLRHHGAQTFIYLAVHLNFMAKKRKLSGLSGADLVLTIEAIEKLKGSLIYEESEAEEGENGDLEGELVDLLSMLKARVGGTKVGTRSVHHPPLLTFCSLSLLA